MVEECGGAGVEKDWLKQAVTSPNDLVRGLRFRQLAEAAKVPVFAELIEDFVEEGKSVVVFVNFRATLDALAGHFAKLNPALIYGGQEDRQECIDRFQENATPLCVCMIQAGGLSVSLHDVKKERPRVSLISPSWNATEVVQTLGRIRRQSGTKALQIFVLAAGTVEEKIHAALTGKLGNIQALNDGDLIPK